MSIFLYLVVNDMKYEERLLIVSALIAETKEWNHIRLVSEKTGYKNKTITSNLMLLQKRCNYFSIRSPRCQEKYFPKHAGKAYVIRSNPIIYHHWSWNGVPSKKQSFCRQLQYKYQFRSPLGRRKSLEEGWSACMRSVLLENSERPLRPRTLCYHTRDARCCNWSWL